MIGKVSETPSMRRTVECGPQRGNLSIEPVEQAGTSMMYYEEQGSKYERMTARAAARCHLACALQAHQRCALMCAARPSTASRDYNMGQG